MHQPGLGDIELRDEHSATFRQAQDNTHNIVDFPSRRPSKAEALMAYARARTTAERFDALMQLADARLSEQEQGQW